jgi:hypothetical protein
VDEELSDSERRALASADPAAGATTPAALRDRVAGIPTRDQTASKRHRLRWPAPLTAAAAAVVVAATVGGGFLLSSGGFDLDPATSPLAVATGSPGEPAPPIGAGAMNAETESASTSNVANDDTVGWWPGRNRFIVPELEKAPPRSEADVYAVDTRSRFTVEEATRVAVALGLSGDVHPDDVGGWRLEEAGAFYGLSSWGHAFFNNSILDPVAACETSAYALHGDDTEAFSREMQSCMAAVPMPSDELVRKSVSFFLAALGIDEDSTRVTLTPSDASRTVTATAERIVENNVTRIAADVTVSAQGITYASGPVGDIVSLGAYPLIGPAEAASRLSDPAFAPELVRWPDQSTEPGGFAPLATPPAVPEAGSAVPWRIAEHEIVSVRLGLTLIDAEGVTYLVPAYEFTASDKTVWSVLAVAESALDTSPGQE